MTRNDLLKKFSIGFIPIFVFIAIDEIYGTEAGLYVAMAVGVFSLIYYLVRYRRLEKFVLFDTALLAMMGGVSLLLHDEIFFKLKPAIIELIIVVLLGIHAFSSQPILLMMGKRYMGDMEIPQAQQQTVRLLSRVLFVVFLTHTGLIVYSAYLMSKEAWAFISGGLIYIMFGLILAGQWLYVKIFKIGPALSSAKSIGLREAVPNIDSKDVLPVVNENGIVIGKSVRALVHKNPALIHPTVSLHVFNKSGQLFLQKRSAKKDLYAGLWDSAAAGHISLGESVEGALLREAQEELGVDARGAKAVFRYLSRNEHESELVHVFKMIYDGSMTLNPEEVETGRYWTIFEIKRLLGQNFFTPDFEQEFALLQTKKII